LSARPLAPAALSLLPNHPVVVSGWAIQLRGAAVEFNGLVDDPVHLGWRRLSCPDSPKLCGGLLLVMSSGLLEFCVNR
jgi:hypothetical protein